MLVYRQLAFEQARLRKESWKSRLVKVYSEHETCEAELTLPVDESWTLAPLVSQCRVPKWADGFSIYYLFIFCRLPLSHAHARNATPYTSPQLASVMEPEATSNSSQLVGSNIENLYGVIDKDK